MNPSGKGERAALESRLSQANAFGPSNSDSDIKGCAALRDVFDLAGYRAMEERGVTELITVPWLFYGDANQSCTQKCDGIRRFADEVLAKR